MSSPLVTVVIPAYNAEKWIGRTIESALSQEYSPFEVVVVDDGSKDDTAGVVRRFGGRVRYIRQQNGGVCRARNHGAAEGRGDLLAFLDADDLWLPGKLQAQVARFSAEPALGTCFTGTVTFSESTGEERPLAYRLSHDLVSDLLLHCTIIGNASSVMVRREVFDCVGGFDPQFSNCADWDMWIRLAGAAPVALVDAPFVRYRVHQGSMSSSVLLLEKDTLALLQKFFSDPSNAQRYGSLRHDVYANQYLVLSGSFLHAGRLDKALQFLALAASERPAAIVRGLGAPVRMIFRSLLKFRRGESRC